METAAAQNLFENDFKQSAVDSVNRHHGSDPCEGLSYSIRVDGKFTDEFRSLIPQSELNPSSKPALWACVFK